MIKRDKIDLSEERRILANLVTDDMFLSNLRGLLEPSLFEANYSKMLVGWIIEFFDIANKAPGKALEDIYLRKKRDISSEEDSDMIAAFLGQLSQDWGKWKVSNVEYSTRSAIEFLKLRSLSKLAAQIKHAADSKDFAEAEHLVGQYKRVEKSQSAGIHILRNPEAIMHAFNREEESLFKFPGALGGSVGQLSRGDFLGILAPPKRGKSWWLWYTAQRAAQSGLKVLYYSLEMTADQMLRRAWCGYVGQPESRKTLEIPHFTDAGDVRSEPKEFQGVDKSLAAITKQVKTLRSLARGGDIRMEFFSKGTLSVKDIHNQLDNLETYDNYIPDVVVIDYADLMRPENGRLEARHQLDDIWSNLRGLSLSRNIFVATATQGGIRKLDGAKEVKAGEISEDARKLAHVTKLMVLNQNQEDKQRGIMRVSCPVQREGDANSGQGCIVLQCLDLGRPLIDSRYTKDTVFKHGDKPGGDE